MLLIYLIFKNTSGNFSKSEKRKAGNNDVKTISRMSTV